MPHPLIDQLRFTRSEWLRALDGVSEEDAAKRLLPMNSISWIVGHLAWQEQRYWLTMCQGQTLVPQLNELVGYGRPATTPPLAEMLAAWRTITQAADPFLDTFTVVDGGDHHSRLDDDHRRFAPPAGYLPLLVSHRRDHGDPPAVGSPQSARFRGCARHRGAIPGGVAICDKGWTRLRTVDSMAARTLKRVWCCLSCCRCCATRRARCVKERTGCWLSRLRVAGQSWRKGQAAQIVASKWTMKRSACRPGLTAAVWACGQVSVVRMSWSVLVKLKLANCSPSESGLPTRMAVC